MDLQGRKQQGASAIDTAAELLRAGKILAIKGIGGYQLVCDATRADTVRLLRERKHRPDKPFALMVANIASLEHWVHSTPADLERLASAAAPVVLMPARDPARLTAIAPGLDQLGLMLPSSPLHILLFHAALGKPDGNRWLEQPQSLLWVATSANLTGAPLIIDDEAAQAQLLGPVADAVLSHNRPILQRCDDSVWQGGEQPQIIRRARGFAPASQPLGFTARPTLALGAALKNTLCLAHGQSAFVSQHIGDLQHPECRAALEHTAKHLMNTFAVRPEQVACDAHPDTPGFHFAEQLARQWAVPLLRIQHHHAHIAAVLAEHGFSPELAHPVIGIALDGFGYGSDGTAWGGELFLFKGGSVRRIGHLRPLRLPGGDMAAREPWRMALSALHETGQQAAMARFREQPGYAIVRQMLDKNSHCPVSTSGGRWFDAVSALLGGPTSQSYEGQAAMVLETMARQYSGDQPQGHTPAFAIEQGVLDLRPALEDTLDAGDSALAALRWHQNLTAAVACWATQAAEQRGAGHIVFSGGCLSNQLLRRGLLQAFSKYSAPLLLPVAMPANDGGISLGQVWMAHFGNQTQCHQKSTTNESSDHVSCHTRSS